MTNPFASLPGNLGARAAAIVAARDARGCNVYFIGEGGRHDRFSFADAERANRFADARRAEGRLVFADAAHAMAHYFAESLEHHFSGGDEFAEIRRRNATADYAGPICASGDFCDSNVFMADAFAAIMGRDALPEDGPMADADVDLWNRAWAIAKREYLTAMESE